MAKKGEFKKRAKERTLRDREYDGSPERKKARAARNKARRQAVREGRARKGDGMDVDHKTPLSRGGSASERNTRVISAKKNRSAGGKIGGRPPKKRGKK